jgi:hypothetical protein
MASDHFEGVGDNNNLITISKSVGRFSRKFLGTIIIFYTLLLCHILTNEYRVGKASNPTVERPPNYQCMAFCVHPLVEVREGGGVWGVKCTYILSMWLVT